MDTARLITSEFQSQQEGGLLDEWLETDTEPEPETEPETETEMETDSEPHYIPPVPIHRQNATLGAARDIHILHVDGVTVGFRVTRAGNENNNGTS